MGRWLGRVQGKPPHPDLKEQENTAPSVSFVSSVPRGTEKSGRWLSRVEDKREGIDTELTELTKAPSVSFVSSVSGHTPKTISVRRAIIRACMGQGITPGNLAHGLSAADLEDIKHGRITIEELREYALFLVMNGHYWVRKTEPKEQTTEPPKPIESRQADIPRANVLSTEAEAAHDEFINHIMICQHCYAPRARYCTTGAKVRQGYLLTSG